MLSPDEETPIDIGVSLVLVGERSPGFIPPGSDVAQADLSLWMGRRAACFHSL